jgi:hypothetical protein
MLNSLIRKLFKKASKGKCEHKGTNPVHIAYLKHAPTKSGGHTNFSLFKCQGCKKVFVFPRQNLELITHEFRKEIEEALRQKGWGEFAT